jgi:poly(3-hydroxybutyrate) depolymerase
LWYYTLILVGIDSQNHPIQMKLIVCGLFFTLLSCSSYKTLDPQFELKSFTVKVGETERSYVVMNPQTDGTQQKPLIVVLHGSMGSGASMSAAIDLNTLASDEGVIVAYPDAPAGNWAEGCGCNNADRLQIPDLEFMDAMIADIDQRYSIDEERIVAAGFSQGGLFATRLACERSTVFAGVVVVAATMSVPLSQTCEPERAIPITFIHGKLDLILPYYGTNNGALSLLAAEATAQFWAQKNSIATSAEVTYFPSEQSREVIVYHYRTPSATRNSDVRLFAIERGNHTWHSNSLIDANREIMKMIGR